MKQKSVTRTEVLRAAAGLGVFGLAGAGSASAATKPRDVANVGAWNANREHGDHERGIEGAWVTTVSAPSLVPTPFHITYAYAEGGSLVESSTLDEQPPTTPGYGSWVRTGERTFRSHIVFFSFDAKGNNSGIGHIHENITLDVDGDRSTSSLSFTFFDLQGHQVGAGTGTSRGERVIA